MDERTKWSNEAIHTFLETIVDELRKAGRKGGRLHKDSWTNVQKKLQEECGMVVSQKQMKYNWDYLKAKVQSMGLSEKQSRKYYNENTNTFTLTNEEWEDVIKVHRKAKSLKHSPLLFFPDL